MFSFRRAYGAGAATISAGTGIPLAEVEAEIDQVAPRAEAATSALKTAADALRALVERRPDDGWARLALARTLEAREPIRRIKEAAQRSGTRFLREAESPTAPHQVVRGADGLDYIAPRSAR